MKQNSGSTLLILTAVLVVSVVAVAMLWDSSLSGQGSRVPSRLLKRDPVPAPVVEKPVVAPPVNPAPNDALAQRVVDLENAKAALEKQLADLKAGNVPADCAGIVQGMATNLDTCRKNGNDLLTINTQIKTDRQKFAEDLDACQTLVKAMNKG